MKSNNPFVTEPEEPLPSQRQIQREREPQFSPPRHSNTPPARPPKPQEEFAPPSYEEAAGTEAAKREYRRKKNQVRHHIHLQQDNTVHIQIHTTTEAIANHHHVHTSRRVPETNHQVNVNQRQFQLKIWTLLIN